MHWHDSVGCLLSGQVCNWMYFSCICILANREKKSSLAICCHCVSEVNGTQSDIKSSVENAQPSHEWIYLDCRCFQHSDQLFLDCMCRSAMLSSIAWRHTNIMWRRSGVALHLFLKCWWNVRIPSCLVVFFLFLKNYPGHSSHFSDRSEKQKWPCVQGFGVR